MTLSTLPPLDLAALMHAEHRDPFAVLGPHEVDDRWWVRAVLPGAQAVDVVSTEMTQAGTVMATLVRLPGTDVFEGVISSLLTTSEPLADPLAYCLRVDWGTHTSDIEDPYRFPSVLGELDVWLLAEGTHQRPFECLGAHLCEVNGVVGVAFAVWAPNAQRVSVVGDFNQWDGRRHMMRLRRECGVWEIFAPHVAVGDCYKFEILNAQGHVVLKADPYAFRMQLRPGTACIVCPLPPVRPLPDGRQLANSFASPMSIYEVHLGSWRRTLDGVAADSEFAGQGRWLSYRELAESLVPYCVEMGFTHIELLPVSEHPLDGSWGYQPIGLYAPSARFGSPDDFAVFVDAAHAAGLGVILDWVPGHFPTDANGLAQFDGTALYEYADTREGFHQDWNTLIFNFARTEVRNYLVGNALYWLERYNIDGLRVDAVASMLYRDYSRKAGEWIPNVHGGRENLEAIAFLQRMNHVVGTERPGAITLAEESTSFPGVTRPPESGGLGFHYKWNMGWMNDTLRYTSLDPLYRQHHQNQLTFGLMYAFTENFLLPLSHDEVVHGKGSLLQRMPGDAWQRFANLRAYYALMWAYPGKKLLFMGSEFAQWAEWNADACLDWPALQDPQHSGVQRLVMDLNRVMRHFTALHTLDHDSHGFQWLSHDDAAQSVVAFARHSAPVTGGGVSVDASVVVVVCNFTPMVRHGYRIGVPKAGSYREIINSDGAVYGGSGVGNGVVQTETQTEHGLEDSLVMTLPPLSTVILVSVLELA